MAKKKRSKLAVTIDPSDSNAGTGGVVPPPGNRWRPGESGNPKGRPKGAATSLDRVLEQELARLVDGDPDVGDKRRISRRRRLVRTLLKATEDGDARAAKLLLDRVWPIPSTKDATKSDIILHFDAQDLEA